VRVAAPLGVNKLRLTGGEPLMRKDLHKLVRLLVPIPGIADIGLTTNGILLKSQAVALRDAGLTRLNVSLDTLDAGRFRELSRRDGLDAVLAGLEEAKALGFAIKLNAVAIRGFIEHDAVPLAQYCREHGFELRFIEYMPIGAEAWERAKCFFAHELLELLEREVSPLAPSPDYDPRAPAMEFDYADGRGNVGIIASVSRPFCKSCNRIRLTADGKVRNCLFAHDEVDVKILLRSEGTEAAIADTIRRNVAAKWEGHEINSAKFVKPLRTMHAIGG
jgi:GTP 3',8-cyclase